MQQALQPFMIFQIEATTFVESLARKKLQLMLQHGWIESPHRNSGEYWKFIIISVAKLIFLRKIPLTYKTISVRHLLLV